jgi:hypothetical protein
MTNKMHQVSKILSCHETLQNWRNKKNCGYMMHLLGYLYEDYHDARSLEHKVIHFVARFTTGPQPLAKRVLQRVRSGASLPIRIFCFPQGHPVAAYVFFLVFLSPKYFPLSYPSKTRVRRQFLRTMWPIQVSFLLFTVRRIFLPSLTLCNTSFLTRSAQLIFSILLQQQIS